MARTRSARGEGVSSIAGPIWQDLRAVVLDGRLPSAESLRQLVPLLLIAFGLVAALGFSYQISSGKDATIRSANGSWL